MYLKRIELEGFKSFADRTVIPVERGLTGIVGPNGCGKSNVVDALLWVLGERSAKILRADAMEDVIFKGSEGRSGAPYSMVEVVMGDPEGKVVEPGGEVSVARRLFSTGESEFLLQGRKVRRKDVRDLMMDTGLGVRGYMVLAQGKIDAVLAANAAERRGVFEEAAGISRYKARKHEARLKLERVAQDLARVDDVLAEIGRVVRSLRLQAGKAKRWLEMRDRYRELRVRIACADSAELASGERRLREAAASLESEIETLRGHRRSAEDRLGALEREDEALRRRHEATRSETAEVKERVAGLEERIAGLETRAAEGDSRVARDRARLAEIQGRHAADLAAGAGLEAATEQALAGLRTAQAEVERAETIFAAARDARTRLREQLERLRQEMLEALDARTHQNNRVAHEAKQRGEAEGLLKALERRRGERAGEASAAAAAVDVLERETGEATRLLVAARQDAVTAAHQREMRRADQAGCAEASHAARQKAAAARARWDAMRAVEEETTAVPAHLQQLRERAGSVAEWVLDGVQIEAPWDRLLENLLGRLQHALWVSDRAAARSMEPAGGAADFLFPRADASTVRRIEGAQPLSEKFLGSADKIAALCRRLGPVYLVATGADAARLAEAHPGIVFLSQDGEAHGPGWVRRGILLEDAAGPLARRNDRDQAQRAAERTEAELARTLELEQRAADALREAEAAFAATEERRRKSQATDDDLVARRENARKRAEAMAQEESALAREEAALRQAADAALQQEAAAAAERDAAEARRLDAETKLQTLQEDAVAADEAYDLGAQALHESRAGRERAEQEHAHAQQRSHGYSQAAQQRAQEVAGVAGEVQGLLGALEALRAEALAARAERDGCLRKRAELSERLEEAALQSQRAAEALAHERQRVAGESGKLEDLLGRRQEQALELQRAEMNRAELVRSVMEEFNQGIEDLARTLGVDPTAPLPAGSEEAALRAELADLKHRIESLGAVNLEAVQELEEREARLQFLERERGDLAAAQANLETTIGDLDRECSQRFMETFTTVQGHFEHIFRRLFRGGRAELTLAEGPDPLEVGIEISVRPPGKELRSINLLSGGERTLTALALLLAVFQSRPSPFCLLDEVDAALDDSNVERFLDVLRDFTATTQFLVVTHNRITMSRCERLFGVTMRKRGVSMVVSVELADIPEDLSQPMDLGSAPAVDAARPRLASPRAPGASAEREMESGN